MNGWFVHSRHRRLRLVVSVLCMLVLVPLAGLATAAGAAVQWQGAVSGDLKSNQGISVSSNAFAPAAQSDLVMVDQMLVGRGGTQVQKVSQSFSSLLDAPAAGYMAEAKIAMDGVYIARTASGAYVKVCTCGTYQMGMGSDPYFTSYRITFETGTLGASIPTSPAPPAPPAPPVPPVPATPGSLQARSEGGQVVLTWGAFATPNQGYYVFKKSGTGGYGLPLTDFPSAALTYADSAVTVGSTYTYVVRSYKDGKYTDATTDATITVTADAPQPVGGVLKATLESAKVDLTWNAFATPNDGYYVYRRTTASFGAPVTDFPILGNSFSDTAVEAGKTYTYVVKAYVGGEAGAPTNEVTVTVAAAQVTRRVVKLQVDNATAEVDGQRVALDVPPQIHQNRTLVPLRFVAEALGADLKWDGAERKITLTTAQNSIILWVDKPSALVGGVETPLDVPPTIRNERTLVPLRFVSENMGAKLKWNAVDRSIELTSEGTSSRQEPQTPALPEPAKPAEPEPAKAAPAEYAPEDWVGTWRCMSFAGNFCSVGWNMEIKADGTWSWGAGPGGAYAANGSTATFEGSAAFLGPAEMFDDGRFTFYYTSKEGIQMYVAYSKE